jgi:hypothetical protein
LFTSGLCSDENAIRKAGIEERDLQGRAQRQRRGINAESSGNAAGLSKHPVTRAEGAFHSSDDIWIEPHFQRLFMA